MFFFSFFELRRHNWPRKIVFSWFLSLMTYCYKVRNHMIKYRWQHNHFVQISQCSRVQECYTMVGQSEIGLSPIVNFFNLLYLVKEFTLFIYDYPQMVERRSHYTIAGPRCQDMLHVSSLAPCAMNCDTHDLQDALNVFCHLNVYLYSMFNRF